MKKYNYIYITTNLINGKQYVGEHSTDNIDDNYLGSGQSLRKAFRKYGRKNFNKEILEHFDTKENAFDNQKIYIDEYNTLSPVGYNISPKGGHQCSNSFSEETRKLIREKRKLQIIIGIKPSDETRMKMSKSHEGKTMSEESKEKNRIKHLKENLSEETLKKMSESASKPRTEEYKQKLRDNHPHLSGEDHPMYGKPGYWKDKHLSEETKEKMRLHKGKNKGPITEKRRLAIIEGIRKKKEKY